MRCGGMGQGKDKAPRNRRKATAHELIRKADQRAQAMEKKRQAAQQAATAARHSFFSSGTAGDAGSGSSATDADGNGDAEIDDDDGQASADGDVAASEDESEDEHRRMSRRLSMCVVAVQYSDTVAVQACCTRALFTLITTNFVAVIVA